MIKLTIVRKYFHGIIVAVYLPGIFFDPDLLFLASAITLAIFLLMEAIRVCDIPPFGDVLRDRLRAFVDEKDQGCLILTHIYLLVGCSLPLWISPTIRNTQPSGILRLCSGIISLGIGDTAASIGGTRWGKRRMPRSKKTVEGLFCSFMAEIAFIAILQPMGFFGRGPFPWIKFTIAALITSTIEATTSQVDNFILPLVMYIVVV
nr:EOG090X0BFL [Cyclestheria hislopi]